MHYRFERCDNDRLSHSGKTAKQRATRLYNQLFRITRVEMPAPSPVPTALISPTGMVEFPQINDRRGIISIRHHNYDDLLFRIHTGQLPNPGIHFYPTRTITNRDGQPTPIICVTLPPTITNPSDV